MEMTVTYKERTFIDEYRCIETIKKIKLQRTFYSGSLLYGYKDRYNVVVIDCDMIIDVEF